MLSNCNSLSGSRLERANKDFHKHISHLNEVKKDLEFIFKKVRSIKTKMAKNNSDAFLGKPILKKCNDFLPLFQSLISNFYFISCGWKFRTSKRRRWRVRCCYQKEISRKRFKTRWYTWYRLSVKIIFLLSSNLARIQNSCHLLSTKPTTSPPCITRFVANFKLFSLQWQKDSRKKFFH